MFPGEGVQGLDLGVRAGFGAAEDLEEDLAAVRHGRVAHLAVERVGHEADGERIAAGAFQAGAGARAAARQCAQQQSEEGAVGERVVDPPALPGAGRDGGDRGGFEAGGELGPQAEEELVVQGLSVGAGGRDDGVQQQGWFVAERGGRAGFEAGPGEAGVEPAAALQPGSEGREQGFEDAVAHDPSAGVSTCATWWAGSRRT